MYLWIGAAISDQFCQQVLDCPSYQSMPDTMVLVAVILLAFHVCSVDNLLWQDIVKCKLDSFCVDTDALALALLLFSCEVSE